MKSSAQKFLSSTPHSILPPSVFAKFPLPARPCPHFPHSCPSPPARPARLFFPSLSLSSPFHPPSSLSLIAQCQAIPVPSLSSGSGSGSPPSNGRERRYLGQLPAPSLSAPPSGPTRAALRAGDRDQFFTPPPTPSPSELQWSLGEESPRVSEVSRRNLDLDLSRDFVQRRAIWADLYRRSLSVREGFGFPC